MMENINALDPANFTLLVSGLKPGLKRSYDRGVNRDLSQQNSKELLKRNMVNVLRQFYAEVLLHIQGLQLEINDCTSQHADNGLREQILDCFDGVAEELMQYALQKHRSSCALSNFPDEHNPDQDYIVEVIRATESEWQGFCLQVKAALSG